jgi:hypothetical protein
MAKRGTTGLNVNELREYAVIGAEARLLKIAEEAAGIYRAFPELRGRQSSIRGAGGSAPATGGEARTGRRRGRRTAMTAAERKAVSDRMKKYWAQRRAGAEGARPARKMSAAARKRISDAQKKRWAAVRKRSQ